MAIHKDTQWPAPDGFHVPTKDERVALYNVWYNLWARTSNNIDNFTNYLKLPFAGYRANNNASASYQGSYGFYWSSSYYNTSNAYDLTLGLGSPAIQPQDNKYRTNGFPIRCFKNYPVTPDNSRTQIYDWWDWPQWELTWIYHNTTLWIISISSDWQNWITISDKNLWATTVWNRWDTLSEANCGWYFQWGNNYMFPFTWSVNTSWSQVDASNYWPWNYYSSSTFITWNQRWDTTDNWNLRWWVTNWTRWYPDMKLHWAIQTFHRERPYEWKPWVSTIAYYKFEWDAKDYSWNSHNLTTNNVTFVTNSWISKTVAYFNWTSSWTNSQAKSEQFSQKLTPSTFICWYKAEANGWSYPNRFTLVELYDNDVSVYTRTWLITAWGSNTDFKVRANRDYAFETGVYPDVWWWWHCVVATIWEWYAKIYLDGELKNSNTYTTADITQNTRVLISWRDTYYNYKWWIGDVIIENKVRTAEDIAKYYNRSKDNYESTPHIPVYDRLLETKDASSWITSSVNYDRYLWNWFDYVSPTTTSYKIVIERVWWSLVAVSPTNQSDSSQYSTSDEWIVSVESGSHPPVYTYFPPRTTWWYIAYLYWDSAG